MSRVDLGLYLMALLLAALLVIVVNRYLPHQRRARYNEVTSFVFAAVAAIYAVLLAFVVVAVWDNIPRAREATFREADALAGLYWISREVPVEQGAPLERLTLEYAHRVVEVEWPLMAERRSDERTTAVLYRMREGTFALNPSADARSQALYEHALSHLEDLASGRRERLNEIRHSVPPLLWITLIDGALVTVGFCVAFGVANRALHLVMALALTSVVAVSLITIKEMNYPFAGVTRVAPTAFQVFLDKLPPPRG
ncbi:hypothetical protein GCM10020229_72260 [Kitasatospora albolonga]|uniref:bestrophin-like domain n=1 Tax=Kitasatospora albolonga TaxID=68173 RepID=UPI0031F189EB